MYLVTGASGQTGARVVDQLVGAGEQVRALTRDPARLADLPHGVDRVVGDLDDMASLVTAMHGVDRLFLMNQGTSVTQIDNAVRAASAAGVSYIAYLSSMSTCLRHLRSGGKVFLEREKLLENSGIATAFLRPGLFASNTLSWAESIRQTDLVEEAGGDGMFAPIDPQDIGDVAAVVLRDPGHAGQRYVLTGDKLMTAAEQVGVLADVLGRRLRYRALPDEVALARLRAKGATEDMLSFMAELFDLIRTGVTAVRTSTVGDLIGRQPRTYRQWAQEHAGDFQ